MFSKTTSLPALIPLGVNKEIELPLQSLWKYAKGFKPFCVNVNRIFIVAFSWHMQHLHLNSSRTITVFFAGALANYLHTSKTAAGPKSTLPHQELYYTADVHLENGLCYQKDVSLVKMSGWLLYIKGSSVCSRMVLRQQLYI